eukprot:7537466-Pyramimonas_sp.AAC.1
MEDSGEHSVPRTRLVATAPLYINADKLPEQLKRELQSKRLVRLLAERHPQHHFRRVGDEGIISIDAVPLVALEIGPAAADGAQLRWDGQVLQ